MAIETGKTLGSFEILGLLGVGGMGEVYRARDAKLGREVAIKVLPPGLAEDQRRLARFEREAKILGSLTHPNIAAVYEVGEADGLHFIAMELIEGQTLGERIVSGRLSEEETLDVFQQLADGLQAAHDSGVIHRDLKPANIMLTPGGKVKILDFGLAKALESDKGETKRGATVAFSSDLTAEGAILGTPVYMSPEQARGEPTDKRADIWAFGCCLYEAMTGFKTFPGKTPQDVLAGVLEREPNWNRLPKKIPPNIEVLLKRCLQKQAHRRLQDIGDARIEFEEARSGSSEYDKIAARALASESRRSVMPFALLAVGLAIGASGVWGLFRSPLTGYSANPPAPIKLAINFSADAPLLTDYVSTIAITPKGDRVVYASATARGIRLMSRPLGSVDAQPIAGTEGGHCPFFSPDGEWLGFFSGGDMFKVPVTGGEPQLLAADAADALGASWGKNGMIVYAPVYLRGLRIVPARGGKFEQLTTPADDGMDEGHLWPQILPGSEKVLFTSWSGGGFFDARIETVDIETKRREVVVEGGHFASYVSTGHIIYARDEHIYAREFDLVTMRAGDEETRIIKGVRTSRASGASGYDVSDDGTLVYLPVGATGDASRLVAISASGEEEYLSSTPRGYSAFRLSPDGKSVALTLTQSGPLSRSILDLERDVLTPFTTVDSTSLVGTWADRGKRLIYGSDRGGGPFNIWWKEIGAGDAQRLTESESLQAPGSWIEDPPTLLFSQLDPVTRADIWAIDFADGIASEPRPILVAPVDDVAPAVSPDGNWLAYTTKESGDWDVYLRSYPDLKNLTRVSSDGGLGPVWSRDGSKLFYQVPGKIMAVTIETEPLLRVGRPYAFYEGPFQLHPVPFFPAFDVDADDRVVLLKEIRSFGQEPLTVVLNWFTELNELAPRASKK